MRDFSIESNKISKITNGFMDLGFSRIVSSTLACLICEKEITSYDIERLSGLRQPEVSYAVRDLRKLKWVSTKKEATDKMRGRPAEIHKLSSSVENVLGYIEQQLNEKHEIEIQKLRNIKASLE